MNKKTQEIIIIIIALLNVLTAFSSLLLVLTFNIFALLTTILYIIFGISIFANSLKLKTLFYVAILPLTILNLVQVFGLLFWFGSEPPYGIDAIGAIIFILLPIITCIGDFYYLKARKFIVELTAVVVLALFLIIGLTTNRQYPDADEQYATLIKGLNEAETDIEKFHALGLIAKEALRTGRIEEAKEYALELKELCQKFPDDWDYGNATHDYNIVLGTIALRQGYTEDAKVFLIKAGETSGSPQLNTFGPNMSLAKELLEAGERSVVIEYFRLCGKFWKKGQNELERWKTTVNKGKIPDFGANLYY